MVALETAFRKGNEKQVKWLFRNDEPDESCWCAGRGWWLSTREHGVQRSTLKVSTPAEGKNEAKEEATLQHLNSQCGFSNFRSDGHKQKL